jgi:recombinase-like zinc beta ribbon protein
LRGKGARGSGYLLSGDGLMKCVRCGYHFHGSTDRKSKIRYYLDGGYHAGGKEVCDMTIVSASEVETHVLNLVEKLAFGGKSALFTDEDELARELERELEKHSTGLERPDPEREALEEKLLQVRRKREEAEKFEREFGQVASGLVSRLREDEAGLERQIAERLPSGPAPMSVDERKNLAREIARCRIDLKVTLEQGTPDEKKRFIRTFVGSIEVDGKDRKIKIGYFDQGGDSALRVMPPTGVEPVSRA